MHFAKPLVAAVALSFVSIAAQAAIVNPTMTSKYANDVMAGEGTFTGKKGDTLSFTSSDKSLDQGIFSSFSNMVVGTNKNNAFTVLSAWLENTVTKQKFNYTFGGETKAGAQLWTFTGVLGQDEQFAKGNYTFNFSATLNKAGTGGFNYNTSVAPVPEPETYALMGLGLVGLMAARRRKIRLA